MKKVYELTVRLYAEEGSVLYAIESTGQNLIFPAHVSNDLRDRVTIMVMAAVEAKPETVVSVDEETLDRVTRE